jgi:hypothetical protein
MSSELVSAGEIESLRGYALSGMQTEVQIFHKTSVANDYSDDAETFPIDPDITIMGWLRTVPDQRLVEDFSALEHPEEGRLFLPVGTQLSRGDKVLIAGVAWSVIDTNEGNTYQVVLRVALTKVS